MRKPAQTITQHSDSTTSKMDIDSRLQFYFNNYCSDKFISNCFIQQLNSMVFAIGGRQLPTKEYAARSRISGRRNSKQ